MSPCLDQFLHRTTHLFHPGYSSGSLPACMGGTRDLGSDTSLYRICIKSLFSVPPPPWYPLSPGASDPEPSPAHVGGHPLSGHRGHSLSSATLTILHLPEVLAFYVHSFLSSVPFWFVPASILGAGRNKKYMFNFSQVAR